MNYEETVDYLFNQVPMFEKQGASGYKEGLSNTYALDNHLKAPHKSFKTIHIAGTNGKGSCSSLIAAFLQNLGFKTGLYTSPHLVDFRERIRINGKTIEKEYVVDFIENNKSFFEPLKPSFFELTTAMAFNYFKDNNVDIAVIEVGLGGRLDCTNIINPELSVITNISLDHTQFLGDTLEDIAKEKAGIIKPNTPVVIGEYTAETKNVFMETALKANAAITFAEDAQEIISKEENNEGNYIYNTASFGNLECELKGDYQIKNINTVLTAIKELLKNNLLKDFQQEIILNSLRDAFKNVCSITGFKGRWQIVRQCPTVICDTGHNIGGWNYITKQLNRLEYKKLHIIIGMVADKDVESVISILPKNAVYYFTKPQNKRALNEQTLQKIAQKYHLNGTTFENINMAYQAAIANSDETDLVFVGGSCYLIANFLASEN